MNPRLFLLAIGFALLVGGSLFLATRDISPTRHIIEKVIGNDRFFK